MKKLIVFAAILFASQLTYSQIFSWGIKGGINSSKIKFDDFSIEGDITVKSDYAPGGPNYNDLLIDVNGDGSTYIINPESINYPGLKFTPSSYEVGFHAGIFTRFKIAGIFLQPEIYYSNTNASIDISTIGSIDDATEKMNSVAKVNYHNLDIPILVGVKLGPFRINAGPVATFKLSNNVSEASNEVKDALEDFSSATSSATFGGQAGIGIDIVKKVTIDARYEFPLSKLGDSVTIGGETFNTDQRQSQFLVSLGFMF